MTGQSAATLPRLHGEFKVSQHLRTVRHPFDGEFQAAQVLANAAEIISTQPAALALRYMQTLLERDGFNVKTLSDPTGVEEEVRTGGYHLIILDLMMPKLDGIEVLRRIRKLDTDIAVVIFTGFPNLESAVASMKLDAVDYIKKPFNVDEFRDVISRVMRKKGLARTPEEQLHRVIGDTIRTLRKEKDLTLKQMSRRTALSVSLLSQIERAELLHHVDGQHGHSPWKRMAARRAHSLSRRRPPPATATGRIC